MLELSLHILDAMRNSLDAGSTRITITIEETIQQDRLVVEIEDNGRGMPAEMVERVLDPFFTTRQTRQVGLGLPLFAQAVRQCRGDLMIESTEGTGTKLKAWMQRSHWDRAPLGDLPGTLITILLGQPPAEIRYTHRVDHVYFEWDTLKLKEALNATSLTDTTTIKLIREYLQENEAALNQGTQHLSSTD